MQCGLGCLPLGIQENVDDVLPTVPMRTGPPIQTPGTL